MTKRIFNNKLCYLCGNPGADTKDHIPPRTIFPKKPIGQLITVPAHYSCNHKFDKDDELFRNLVVAVSWRIEEGRKAWDRVTDSFKKNPGARREIIKRIVPVVLKNPITGEKVLYKGGIKIDVDLVKRQIQRWTRGLYFKLTKKPLPLDISIDVNKLKPPEISIMKDLKIWESEENISIPWKIIEPNVFMYTFNLAFDKEYSGFAIFVFFNTEVCMSSIGNVSISENESANI